MAGYSEDDRELLRRSLAAQGIALPDAPVAATPPPLPTVNPIAVPAAQAGITIPGLQFAPPPAAATAPPPAPIGPPLPPNMRRPAPPPAPIISATLPANSGAAEPNLRPYSNLDKKLATVQLKGELPPNADLSGMSEPGQPALKMQGVFAQGGGQQMPTMPRAGSAGSAGGSAMPAFAPRVAPQALAEAEKGFGQLEQGRQANIEAIKDNEEDEAAMLRRHVLERQALEMRSSFRDTPRQSKLSAEWQNMQDERERLRKEGAEIGPDAFWKDKNTGQKFLLVLGAALQDFGAGIQGRQGHGLESLNAMIDQHIAAQKARYAAHKETLGAQADAYGQLRQQFTDERQADAVYKQAMLDYAADEAKAMAIRTGSRAALAQAQNLAAETTLKHADWLSKAYGPLSMGGGAGAGGASKSQDEEKFVSTGDNGEGFFAGSKQEGAYGRSLQFARQVILPKLDRLEELRKKTNVLERAGESVYQSPEMAEMHSIQATLATDLRQFEKIRGFGDEITKQAQTSMGDFSRALGHPEAAARAFRQTINDQISAFERAQGGQGAIKTMGVDQNGNPVAVAVPQSTIAAPAGQMPGSFRAIGGMGPAPTFKSPQKAQAPQFVLPPKSSKGRGGGRRQAAASEEESDEE